MIDVLGLDHVSDVEQTDFVSYMVVAGDLGKQWNIRHIPKIG